MKESFDLHDRTSFRRVLRFVLLAVIIGFGVNIVLSLLMDRSQILGSLRRVRVIYFVVPLLLFVASLVVDTLRLMLVVAQFKIRLTFVQAFFNSCVGNFFTNITPLTAGGQPFQIFHLRARGVPPEIATNVIMSRFVEQAMTSLLISILFLTQISWIAATLGFGRNLIYIGLGISLTVTLLLLALLIWPHFIGRVAMLLESTFLGRLIGRISGKHNWAPRLQSYSHRLRENVRILWSTKTPVMILDILLGLGNILLHAYSLLYVLDGVVGTKLPFLAVAISYVILWQIVFYVPTPGAAGSVEGAFALVYSGMTADLGATVIAVFVWRISTYYLLLLFDAVVYAALGKAANTTVQRSGS